ncbi:glycoprotein [Neuropteran phasma-related virus OKIAV248]|uniref:Glycoprotein n=1 Tax=Neuropteran phasma-related virus OKIAV248 TaxID=2789453 RepID=A0A7U3S2F0_9VIRU|nr:glycoprotein [Neuropteran phasma-related virus OKIAV248]QPB73988.1 glycoprotein [Neuropteran phasma-related virus OKIAV248]
MQFLIITLMFSLVNSQYVRELHNYNDNYGFDDLNKLATLNQKDPNIIIVEPNECTASKCSVKLSETFNMIADKGYGVSYKLSHTGLMNNSLDFFVKDVNYNLTNEYMYTTPMTKIYYRIAFKNYDIEKFDNCVNSVGIDDFSTIADVMISGIKGKDWDFAYRQSKVLELGPLSTDSIKCGHFWPTTLTTCVEKAVIIRLDKGISLFKLSNEVNMDLTLSALLNDKQYDFVFKGDFNQPQIWNIKDNLNIEINPIGTIISPLSGYIACFYHKKEYKTQPKCYHMRSAPELGTITNTGIGKFQLVNLNTPEKLLFDKDMFIGNMIYSCNDNKLKKAKMTGFANEELRSKVFELYNLKKSDQQEDKLIIDVKQGFTAGLKLGDTCCLKIISPTDLFLENSISSFNDIRDTFKNMMIIDPITLDVSTSNYPILSDLTFKKLIRQPLLVSLLSENLDISFDNSEYEIKELTIPNMVYYQDAAGSYFSIRFEFIGRPQNIKIDSEDINILTKELYVHKSGKVDELIGFKSRGLLTSYPKICVGKNEYCVKPNTIDNKSPKDGIIDDNELDNGEYIDRAKNFLWRIFTSNWLISFVSFIIASLEVILGLVILVMIYKISRKFFTILCCASVLKESNALITSKLLSKFPSNSKTMISEYTGFGNVGIFLSNSDENSLINSIIENENGFNLLYCTSVDVNELKEVDCSPYCSNMAFQRSVKITKSDGTTVYKGDIWGTDIALSTNDGGMIKAKYKKNLFKNETSDDNSACMKLWGESMANKKSIHWIKETVSNGYDSKFGYSTIKLSVVGKDNSIKVFELADHLTLYDGFDVLELRKFGKMNSIHAVEAVVVSDSSLSNDDRLEDLKRSLSLSDSTIIHSVEIKKDKYISRHYYLIQCEDRCTVVDPTSDNKSKEIIINKYYPIVNMNLWRKRTMAELTKFCKNVKELRNVSVDIDEGYKNWTAGSKKIEHFKVKWGNSKYVLHIKHFEKGFDKDCNMKIKFNQMYKNGFFYSNFLIDNEGTYDVKRGGPITINCANTGKGSRCKHLNNELTSYLNDGSNDIELRSIKYKGMVYQYSIGEYVEHVSPVVEACKGKIFVDQQSSATCSHDCCLVSNDHWQSFKILRSDNKYELGNRAIFSQWHEDKKLVYNLKQSNWCDYSGLYNSFECLYKEYWIECIIVVGLPITMFIVYYTILAIYYSIIWCFSNKPKTHMKYMRTKRYNKKWFFVNMAENIAKGKPRFWEYKILPSDDDYSNGPGNYKQVYRRTIRPVV